MRKSIFAIKYGSLCVCAIMSNLCAQRIVLSISSADLGIVWAVLIGTFVGLIVKFVLDKAFIFNESLDSPGEDIKKFILYSLNGVLTTTIFWVSELTFFWVFATTFAREAGAVLGLTIGYYYKYRLDRKYVFRAT